MISIFITLRHIDIPYFDFEEQELAALFIIYRTSLEIRNWETNLISKRLVRILSASAADQF